MKRYQFCSHVIIDVDVEDHQDSDHAQELLYDALHDLKYGDGPLIVKGDFFDCERVSSFNGSPIKDLPRGDPPRGHKDWELFKKGL